MRPLPWRSPRRSPAPSGRRGCEALLRVADELCLELGCEEEDVELAVALSAPSGSETWSTLNPRDESLVATLRQSLARIATALGLPVRAESAERSLCTALDGVELVMRGELMRGNVEQLPSLMPGFVFLVALTVVGQDEALDLSQRAKELIERELR